MKVDLQELADVISNQSAHITAQRFVIQTLWLLMKKKGLLDFPEISDPMSVMADRAYGNDGVSANPEVLLIIREMVGEAQKSAEIIHFPDRQ